MGEPVYKLLRLSSLRPPHANSGADGDTFIYRPLKKFRGVGRENPLALTTGLQPRASGRPINFVLRHSCQAPLFLYWGINPVLKQISERQR